MPEPGRDRVDDDECVTDMLATGLERTGRAIITCNDIESAQLVLEWMSPSHIVADVRLSGAFAFEGLDFIRYVKRQLPESKVILMSGDTPDELQYEASERGAVSFLHKPFDIEELDAVIEMMTEQRSWSASPPLVVRIPPLDEIVNGSMLHTLFQPIVELGTGWAPFGYESLSRCRTDSPFGQPEQLFAYAARKQRICDLELACMATSLRSSGPVLDRGTLFLNVHPSVFGDEENRLEKLLRSFPELDFENVVLEVTEQGGLIDRPATFDTFDRLRNMGLRFAFDDFGIAYSHLPFIGRVRPSFLKVSQHFGTRFEADYTKVKVISNIVAIAKDFGCQTILEGIEDASTAEAAADLGIQYGQGYLFGRPTEPSAFSISPVPMYGSSF